MSAGGSSGTSTTELNPQILSSWLNLDNSANQISGQNVPQQQVAGFTPTQQLGQSFAVGTAGAGIAPETDATNSLDRLSTSTYSPGVAATSENYVGNVANPQQGDLSQYLNPYQQDVVDTTMQQADLARQQDINSNQSAITGQGGEGAWNGARAGVQNAQTNALIQGQEAQQLAGLNTSNFTNAQQAAQNWGQLDLTANQGNQALQQNVAATNAAAHNASDLAEAGYLNDTADRQLSASEALSGAAPTLQGLYTGAANTDQSVGATQQAQQQNVLNTNYQNQLSQMLLPLQTQESAFGIIPSTSSGSTTNSSGKSAGLGG